MDEIKYVTAEEAEEIICTREPVGLFYSKEGSKFIAIDNSTGDAWTEEFDNREECMEYLQGDESRVR
jgi:hypothetical protein